MEIKVWEKEEIQENLKVSDVWVSKAIVAIFEKQTVVEQCSGQTTENNGVGFTAFDAEILSSFAKQIVRWQQGKTNFHEPLRQKQMVIGKKRIYKYAGQLTKIANKEL